jgi:hypothetical protein
MAAPTPGPTPATPKMLEVFQKGETMNVGQAPRTAPRLSAARRR